MSEARADRIVMPRPKETTKGVTLYSVISAQAGAASDAALRILAGLKLDEFKVAPKTYLLKYDDLCDQTLKVDLKGMVEDVYNALQLDAPFLMDAWKAGLGLQMGTAFMGLVETYTGYPQILGMYNTEKFDASLRPILSRYFLSKYTPNIPDVRTAFDMLMEGQIDRKGFNQYLLEAGWSTKLQDKLYEIMNREPDEFLAFTMYKRGLIKEPAMKQCFRIRGYDAIWDKALYQALHRVPTLRELIMVSDFVQLPDIYVSEVLRQNGYTESTVNYVVPAIRMRPLREETRSVVGRYLWEYQIGRIDRATLEKNLKALGLLPKEVELNMTWGDLRYADELLDEELEIIEARVQYGDPDYQDPDAVFSALVTLGIAGEKANLMSELWYYKYVYVPP